MKSSNYYSWYVNIKEDTADSVQNLIKAKILMKLSINQSADTADSSLIYIYIGGAVRWNNIL